ncbi:hypothetical protein CYMTET_34720 [Cymbomonas tetramitiformis]|uniref:Kinesin-like protein n=1 Tax=Cymbomonas tetramitiformis TaxID=36881 RepID=A0AAE0KPN9_9CHLO|nr:hypothetical protein CYMTET_34720 [Cymbomonas tetramitiformis]
MGAAADCQLGCRPSSPLRQVRRFDTNAELKEKDDLIAKQDDTDRLLVDQERQLKQAASRFRDLEVQMRQQEQGMKEVQSKYTAEYSLRRELHEIVQELRGNIRVLCRVRPLKPAEYENGDESSIVYLPEECKLRLTKYNEGPFADMYQEFEFDHIFPETSSQEEVFAAVKPAVQSLIDGFNVCIFAYGQTGSGKTFTMEGVDDNRGVNYRALDYLFDVVGSFPPTVEADMEISMVEIYNETVRDLLAERPAADEKLQALDIKFSVKDNSGYVVGLEMRNIENMEQVEGVLAEGHSNRATASTRMNEHSSRSHAIVSVFLTVTNKLEKRRTVSKLHLIDLAGSERLSKSGCTSDDTRLKESQAINKSLSALAEVIASLQRRDKHIPYRNTKLTFFLQDSLGGKAKTLMFVNLSPHKTDVSESLSSLGESPPPFPSAGL